MEREERVEFDATQAEAALGDELRLVTDAIDAVAAGAASSVSLVNISFGEELLKRAQALAASHGLRVRPIFPADEHGADLVVERRWNDER